MAMIKAVVKPDDASLEKYYYLCQTPGCGEVINKEFAVGLKNPSPKWCDLCKVKENRQAIEQENEKLVASKTQ